MNGLPVLLLLLCNRVVYICMYERVALAGCWVLGAGCWVQGTRYVMVYYREFSMLWFTLL